MLRMFVMQKQEWYQRPGPQCRHSFISMNFDGFACPKCERRCDICKGENQKFNVLLNFDSEVA
jgi:hypothetical protein